MLGVGVGFRGRVMLSQWRRVKGSAVPLCCGRRNSTNSSSNGSLQELFGGQAPVHPTQLLACFREYGHLNAHLNPLQATAPQLSGPLLRTVEDFLLEGAREEGNVGRESREALVQRLREVYCGTAAVQVSHMMDDGAKAWLLKEWESMMEIPLQREEKREILRHMLRAELLDHFLTKKHGTVKRYGLEGAEATIPAVSAIMETMVQQGAADYMVIGMPHRGRLNLLVELLDMPARVLFNKVRGQPEFKDAVYGIGDVLSHLGWSTDLNLSGGSLHVSLIHNPSHLEAVNPVAMGKVLAATHSGKKAMTLLIHGDAAFSGQGVVPESLALSRLPDYSVNGTVHLIVNNQVGFTTPSKLGRSSPHASDVAKMIGAPLLLVNAEDPEMVTRVSRIAANYRIQFQSDVVVELVGYRRHGHNEVDEPAFTQPTMYGNIRSRDTITTMYTNRLLSEDALDVPELEEFRDRVQKRLADEYAAEDIPEFQAFQGSWSAMKQVPDATATEFVQPATGVRVDRLLDVARDSVTVPDSVKVHDRLLRTHIQARLKRVEQSLENPDGKYVDWAMAEACAVGTLLQDGVACRLSGQDCTRGTFSQRHWGLFDQETDQPVYPFDQLRDKNAHFQVVNSPLSEFAVMGFEYGYSIHHPNSLPMWEAQFGDFNNGAQIIMDQFVSSGEAKWLRQSGLVLMLPHGYDGAGPEHSSAKPERFLQMCDVARVAESRDTQYNWQVANCTTPANLFHILRRQVARPFRKPLVLIGPKTILRLPQAVSSISEMGEGTCFQPVLLDPLHEGAQASASIQKVAFCSGKIYYDMLKERQKFKQEGSMTFVRIEELCPFPYDILRDVVTRYPNAQEWIWLQEEPENQGAFSYVQPKLEALTNAKLRYVGRPPCPASAVGFPYLYRQEVEQLAVDLFA